jgi:hypothetical protein
LGTVQPTGYPELQLSPLMFARRTELVPICGTNL